MENLLIILIESFLIKSVIGNSNEGGNVKGIFSKLHDDIFSIGVNSNSVLNILGEGNTTPVTPTQTECVTSRTECVTGTGVTTSTCTNVTSCSIVNNEELNSEEPSSTTSTSISNNITLKDKMYREYIIYTMELLYCKMAVFSNDEEKANQLFNISVIWSALDRITQEMNDFNLRLDIDKQQLTYHITNFGYFIKVKNKNYATSSF